MTLHITSQVNWQAGRQAHSGQAGRLARSGQAGRLARSGQAGLLGAGRQARPLGAGRQARPLGAGRQAGPLRAGRQAGRQAGGYKYFQLVINGLDRLGLLLLLSLPPYQGPGSYHGDGNHGDDTWEEACSTVWDYIKDVVDEEYNNTALYWR